MAATSASRLADHFCIAQNVGCDVPRCDRPPSPSSCQDSRTGGFCTPRGVTVAYTDEYLAGDLRQGPAITCPRRNGGNFLLKNPPLGTSHFFYSVYYCSQATFQLATTTELLPPTLA
jgi:hypothetical protein